MQENINETSIDKKYMGATGANRFLLITLLCYMGSSFVLQLLANLLGGKIPFLRDTLFLLLAGQIALVVPAIVFFVKNKINVTEFLRIKRMHPITWILIIVFSYASYPIISLCNYLSLQVSENVIDGTMQDILEKYPIAICVIAVALIPCMVEETIFRGVMYQSYKRAGFFKALFMTAILFGFFHMNINQMSYAIVIGLLFVCLNEATGSILSSIFMHFIINGTSILSSAAIYKRYGSLQVETTENMLSSGSIVRYLVIASVFCVAILALLLYAMMKIEHRDEIVAALTKPTQEKQRMLSPALVVVLVICVAMMALSQMV